MASGTTVENQTITHRIVSIEEDGIHTRGDNNERQDQYPVTVNGYVAKVGWWCYYAGFPLWFMFELGGFYWLAGAVVVNGVVVLWLGTENKERKKHYAEVVIYCPGIFIVSVISAPVFRNQCRVW